MNLPLGLNIVDIILLAVLALFCLRGALNGLVKEMTGLVGLIFGIWLAGHFYGRVGQIFGGFSSSDWIYVVAYVFILVVAMLVVSIVARILHKILTIAYADWLNHLAGLFFGLVKGGVICAIMITVMGYFMPDTKSFNESRIVPVIQEAMTLFKDNLPPGLADYLDYRNY